MGDEHMVDARQLFQAQIADAGAAVDQDVVIHQHGGGAQRAADATAATEYGELHTCLPYFVLKVNTPSHWLSGGCCMKNSMRSRYSV